MSILDRVFSRRAKLTVNQLAGSSFVAALKAAWEGPDSLYERLVSDGGEFDNPFEAETESLIFIVAAFDLAIVKAYGELGRGVREHLSGLAIDAVVGRIVSPDPDSVDPEVVHEHIMSRIASYVVHLVDMKDSTGLTRLGSSAYRNISGGARTATMPTGMIICSTLFMTVLQGARESLEKVDLIPG